jgi:hypothetical protein
MTVTFFWYWLILVESFLPYLKFQQAKLPLSKEGFLF